MDVRPRFGVAPHIRFCRIEDQMIVLDLLHNRYAGVGGATAAALASILERSESDQLSMFDADASDQAALLEPLRAQAGSSRCPGLAGSCGQREVA